MPSPTELAEKALDKISKPRGVEVPQEIKSKLTRGKRRLDQLKPRREEAVEFANNRHYVGLSEAGDSLVRFGLTPIAQGGTMPDHRVRRSHDLIGPIVKRKVSAATQRVPGYEIIPTTTDQDDYGAAKLGEKIAAAGYDKWRIKKAMKKLVWCSLVEEEAFVTANWDSSVGPYVDISKDPETGEPDPENPEHIGMGEVSVDVFGGREVMWEPGVDFEDSPWWAIVSARPVDVVEAEEGFIGGENGKKLKPDADASTGKKSAAAGSNLVMVTQYIERPCPKYTDGQRRWFANDREIFPEAKYPQRDHEDNVVDEPCIHRLCYSIDGSSDRGRGLVSSLTESMRTYDAVSNKIVEWMQIMIVPQMTAPEGSLVNEITDEPGAVIEYDPAVAAAAGQIPQFRQVQPMPQELLELQDRTKAEMGGIAFDNEVPAQLESGKAVQSFFQEQQLAWMDFIFDLADVHARLMRDCLTWVQLKYSEDRMIQFRGRTGWEHIADFRGADLRGQTDVRVQPGSLEPRTRAALEQRIINIREMFPEHFPPEVVVAALNSATPDKLIEGYEEDISRAHRVISRIKAGTFEDWPDRPVIPGEDFPQLNVETGEPEVDPISGEMVMLTEVPGWMPRPFDNVSIHRAQFEGWMKTDDFDELDDEGKRAAMIYYQALIDLETREAARKSELQTQVAEQMGAENAARPRQEKSLPSQPSAKPPPEEGAPAEPAGA